MSPVFTAIWDIVKVLVVIIIAYILLSMILSFCWNRSIKDIFGQQEISWTNAFFLILTLHILMGTFSNLALSASNNSNMSYLQTPPHPFTSSFSQVRPTFMYKQNNPDC